MSTEYTGINEIKAKILKKLQTGGKRTKNIYWDVGITWFNCEYHLKTLKEIGLVKTEKTGIVKIWILTEKGHECLRHYS